MLQVPPLNNHPQPASTFTVQLRLTLLARVSEAVQVSLEFSKHPGYLQRANLGTQNMSNSPQNTSMQDDASRSWEQQSKSKGVSKQRWQDTASDDDGEDIPLNRPQRVLVPSGKPFKEAVAALA